MFWRRKKPEASREDAGDDLAALQRQFGIKTVSDKDVEADLRKLLGASLATDLSPRTEQALVGGGDSDEEAAILRQLNLGGDLDAIDVDALSGGEDEDDVARRELQGVLGEAHRTAQANASRQDVAAITRAQQSQGEAIQEQIHRMKLEAVTLKREGKVQEALAVFREVKTLEAKLASGAVATTTTTRTVHVAGAASQQVVTTKSPDVVVAGVEDDDDKDVEVTDDDMENPEFLAQLAALGMPITKPQKPVETVESLERAIRESKERAVQLKRSDRIADALAEMRKLKEMQSRLDNLRAKSAPSTVAAPPTLQMAAEASVVSVSAISVESAADDSDEEVTDEDLNDPAYAAELQKLGFNPFAEVDKGSYDDDETKDEESDTVATLPETSGPCTGEAKQQLMKKQYSSVDDNDLIDEFDDHHHESENNGTTKSAPHLSDNSEETSDGQVGSQSSVPTSAQESAISILPFEQTAGPPSSGSRVEDLLVQLEHTKQEAVRLKREGDLQAALDMMRRVKQIETLIEMKQRQSQPFDLPPQPPRVPAEEIERQRKFSELEAVLVRYANEATQEAKNQLSINRAKAAEWLARRKEYSAMLTVLREKRKIFGQDPPFYHIEQLTEQVEIENTDVPLNEVHLRINSVNDLQQAAGRDIFIKFNMSFPSNAPHEGKTGGLRISPAAPFGSGGISNENFFRLSVQRGRGTQRLFEIKKAVFEVWRPGTLLRNPEFVARGYQELAPLLTNCELKAHVPFVGPNRKPVGGDVEISLRIRTPMRDKQYKALVTEVVRVGEYPPPRIPLEETITRPASAHHVRPHSQSELGLVVETNLQGLPHAKSVPTMATASFSTPTAIEATDLEDPHNLDLIISYDVINDEIERIEAELPNMKGDIAVEMSDRLDSLGLKKQLLEIEMQTGKLTLDMYVAKLKQRILDDRAIIKQLMKNGCKNDAKRVLHRVKLMEKELEGAEDDGDGDVESQG